MFNHINKLIILSIVLSLFFIPTINANAFCLYNQSGQTPGEGEKVKAHLTCGLFCFASREIDDGARACITNLKGFIQAARESLIFYECDTNVDTHGWVLFQVELDGNKSKLVCIEKP